MAEEFALIPMPSAQQASAAIGDTFIVTGRWCEPHRMELEEVRAERPRCARVTDRMAYSMFFRGKDDSGEIGPMRMGVYNVTHPKFGCMALFLIPRSTDSATGHTRYEAVFD